MANKNRAISNISYFMTFMVIIFHTYNIEKYGFSNSNGGYETALCYYENVINHFGRLGVATFFIISGYLFFLNSSFESLESKLLSRLKTILLPYIIWTVIYYFIFAIIPKLPLSFTINTHAFDFSIETFVDCLWNSIAHLWYLRVLMCCFIVSPICCVIINKMLEQKITHILVYVIVFIYLCSHDYISQHTANNSFFNWFYFFLIGSLLALDTQMYVALKKMHSSLLFAALGIVLYVILGINTESLSLIFASLTFGVSSAYIIISRLTERFHLSLVLPVNTFWIYMTHYIILEVISKLIYVVLGVNVLGAFINYIVTPLLTLGLCIVSGFIFKRFCPKIYNLFTGGR